MSRKMYNYFAFGLNISSEIHCPELHQRSDGEADVTIRYGDVPQELDNPIQRWTFCEANADQLLLKIKDVAHFLISYGREIRVQMDKAVTDEDLVRLFVLGAAFAAVIHQRGALPLHASAIVHNNHVMAFSGKSGAGKSTLAAALSKRGYPIVGDDICVLSFGRDGLPMVVPGYPQLKLWQEAADKLEVDTSQLNRICSDDEKYAYPLSDAYWGQALSIHKVFCLEPSPVRSVKITSLVGMEKIDAFMGNIYRPYFAGMLGKQVDQFKLCSTLAGRIQVKHVRRPNDGFYLDELVDLLVQDFENGK